MSGAQQVLVIAAMRLMTGIAALPEHRLMMNLLLGKIADVGMAADADIHRIGLRQSRLCAGVGVMTIGAIAGRAGMLHLRLFDLFRLVGVAGNAKVLDVGLGQNHFAVFRRGMAGIATLVRERRMLELGHQLGCGGLMRIMALQAIRRGERLILVGLLQRGIFQVMAIGTKRRGSLRQVKLVFKRGLGAGLVRHVAGIASHVERGVTAAFFRNIQALGVAGEAEIVCFPAGGGLQQLELIVRGVRIVALQAVAHRRLVDISFDLGGVFVGVTGQAELVGSRRDQLDAGDVAIDPDLVATQAAHRDGGMDELTLALFAMAFKAFGGICFWVQRNRVNRPPKRRPVEQRQTQYENDFRR